MKWLVCALLISSAQTALAWEFTAGTPCLLTHEEGDVQVELTYDPGGPLYSISVTRTAPFPNGPIFSMQFNGSQPLGISTDRMRCLAPTFLSSV